MAWKHRSVMAHHSWAWAIGVLTVLAVGLLAVALLLDFRDRGDAADLERAGITVAEQVQALERDLAEAMEQGKVASLLPRLSQLMREHPDEPQTHLILANATLSLGQFERALGHLEEALQLDPKQAQVHLLAGTVAMELNRPNVAGKHYNQALELDPSNNTYRLHLASAYMKQRQFNEARGLLLQALQRDPELDKAYGGLAQMYALQNKLGLAMSHLTKAMELARNNPQADQRYIGYVLRQAKLLRRDNRPDEALLVIAQLPESEQLRLDVLESRAMSFAQKAQPHRSAKVYVKAMEQQPQDWRFAAGAARWYIKAQYWPEARRMINRVRQLDPHAPELESLEAQMRNPVDSADDDTSPEADDAPTLPDDGLIPAPRPR